MNTQLVFNGILSVVVAILGVLHVTQSSEIDALNDEVAALSPTTVAPHRQRGPRTERASSDPQREDQPDEPRAKSDKPKFQKWDRRSDTRKWGDEPDAVDRDIVEAIDSHDPDVREKVREMMREENEILREERREVRAKKWAERQNTALKDLQEKTGMTTEQRESVSMFMEEERTKMSDIWRSARENMDFKNAREKAMNLRAETDQRSADVLDEDQMTAFQEMREENSPRFMRRLTREREPKPDKKPAE